MVAKTLEYLGDVLKYVKPYLKAKGPPEGIQLTYWIAGNYFVHPLLLGKIYKASVKYDYFFNPFFSRCVPLNGLKNQSHQYVTAQYLIFFH